MRRLIFADVHANLPAFQAVLEAAKYWDEAWFLGDIVGCGPNPKQCIELLKQTGAVSVAGNHDVSICKLKPGAPGNYLWDEWSRFLLDAEDIEFLHTMLPFYSHEEGERLTSCLHTPPGAGYLHPHISAGLMASAFSGIKGDRLICGHSHHLVERDWQGRSYTCIRAVGQPRDADPRAGYSIEEDGILKHFRVEYDVDRLLFDLRNIGLEHDFLNRWMNFASTGYDREWSRLE